MCGVSWKSGPDQPTGRVPVACSTAAIESPPPMIVVPRTSATARATAIVPFANVSISNTPIGPFQTTVLASFKASVYRRTVSGPMSRPILSPIAGSSTAMVSAGAPGSSCGATT